MVTDRQVRRLMKYMQTEKTKASAAAKAGMDEKTARKYRRLRQLPSDLKPEHSWRTREDPFAEHWNQVHRMLSINPGLQAKTIFKFLQRTSPGTYQDGQLRTLQRRVKTWRVFEGPPKEVFFPQVYKPGILCQSDFTRMGKLDITIHGQPFKHMLYHFVLPYSNWETGTICFSESFEALSEGFQTALWELGGVPEIHRTDRLTTAVNKTTHPEEFTQRYAALLRHYKIKGTKIQSGQAHENGDIEQRHFRLKEALDQSLMLRGSRDFDSRTSYARYLKRLFAQLNANRSDRFKEELTVLRRLPVGQLDSSKRLVKKIGKSSTVRLNHNVYSVDSRLRGEVAQFRLYAEHLEVWYAQRCIHKIPRLFGEGKHHIQYRHIIDSLVRKPGAFANYRYQEDLFPTHRFRMAYDVLKDGSTKADKEYLKILHLAAKESETAVDQALAELLDQNAPLSFDAVRTLVISGQKSDALVDVTVEPVDLSAYDTLLGERSER
jgi:hypothetical protein